MNRTSIVGLTSRRLRISLTQTPKWYSTQPENANGEKPTPHRHTGPSGAGRIGGMPLPDIDYGSGGPSKWGSMTSTEKVKTAVKQTSSFGIVLAGGTLAAFVLYALGSELWSKDSPNRYYEEAINIVKESEQINSILYPPLKFFTTPPGLRRRQNMNVQSTMAVDPRTNQDVMFIKFWVEAGDPHAKDEPKKPLLKRIHDFIRPIVWDRASYVREKEPEQLTVSEALDEVHHHPKHQETHPSASTQSSQQPSSFAGTVWHKTRAVMGSAVAGFIPSFTRGNNTSAYHSAAEQFKPERGFFKTSEITGELVRDPATQKFVFSRLIAEFPTSASPNPYRISLLVPPQQPVKQWWKWWG